MKNKIYSKLIILLALVLCLAACDGAVHLPGMVRISLDYTSLNVSKGYTKTLTATVTPDSAAETPIVWESSDTDIATVDKNGVITGKEFGKAKITAKAGNATATCDIEVVSVPAKSIVLYYGDYPIIDPVCVTTDSPTQITAKFIPEETTDKSITWTIGNTSVAEFTSDSTDNPCSLIGKVFEYSTTLTAQGVGGVSATCGIFNNTK